jgi:hypothetical protein
MLWAFDRITRIEAIIGGHLTMLKFLRAERIDTLRHARGPIDRRLAIVETRLARFRSVARAIRHNARSVA